MLIYRASHLIKICYFIFRQSLSEGWHYVADTRGIDYYSPASRTIVIGTEVGCAGAGDCDDFAILMSALIESVGGATRIILAYNRNAGHAYPEVYLGRLDAKDHHVEDIIDWLKTKYSIDEVYVHMDPKTREVWLNLDWSADNPGGPFYKTEKQVVLVVRGVRGKVPLNVVVEKRARPPKKLAPFSVKVWTDKDQYGPSETVTIYWEIRAEELPPGMAYANGTSFNYDNLDRQLIITYPNGQQIKSGKDMLCGTSGSTQTTAWTYGTWNVKFDAWNANEPWDIKEDSCSFEALRDFVW